MIPLTNAVIFCQAHANVKFNIGVSTYCGLPFYDAYIGGTLSMAVEVLIPAPDSARITSYKLSLQYERLKASDIGFTK